MTYLYRGERILLEVNDAIMDARDPALQAKTESHMTYFEWPMPPPPPLEHGSQMRHQQHLDDGEEPCGRCRDRVERSRERKEAAR